MNWGLLSTAHINDQIIAAAAESDRAAIVAVASRDKARAAEYALAKKIPRAHGSYDALLADPDVDAVYISLPNALHHEWSMRALAAGKHVLCEKPYSRHPKEVEEAYAAAAAAGRVLMEAFMYRHHPQTKRLLELVRGGAVGRVTAIKGIFTFFLRQGPNVRLGRDLDGGSLMDVGCYCVNGARLIAGEPLHVVAEQVAGPSGVDVGFYGTMRHEADVVSQFESSFIAPRRQRLEVVGEDGVLLVEAPWRVDWRGQMRITRGADVEIVEVQAANSYRLELENVADAAAGHAPALLGRADALGQARTLDALYRSANERRAVELSDA